MKRQLVHIGFGTLFIALTLLLGAGEALLLLALAFILGLVVSNLLRTGMDVPVFSALVGHVERLDEKKLPGKGALLFFLGAALLLYLCVYVLKAPYLAAPALVPVVFGDGISTIVGSRCGKHWIAENKSLEGSLSGFLAAFAVLLLPAFGLFPAVWKAFVLAAGAMLVELMPLNDNLSVPVASGLILYIIF